MNQKKQSYWIRSLQKMMLTGLHDITVRLRGRIMRGSNMRISYFSPPTIYTDFPSQSSAYISSNNLEHILCFINTAQSGLNLVEAEPATDYLVRELGLVGEM